MIRAIIVDDERHAREELAILLRETGAFELLDCCTNAIEALKVINRKRPDLLFLDIDMPVVNGFDLLGMIDEEIMPHVVFVTAYDDYALKAFEEKTLDYLLKPVDEQRLYKMIEKVRGAIRTDTQPTYPANALERIPSQCRNRIKLITLDEIDYVCSDIGGVYLVTEEGRFYTDLTLKVLEARTLLLRCHKQYLMNPKRIAEVSLLENGSAELRTVSKNVIPVSRRFLRQIKSPLGL